jgi:hypothetical protein
MPGGWNRVREALRDAQANQPLFANAPMIIQETLLFPYINGADYIRRFRQQRRGQSPLADLPVSTEQLLHDSAFFAATRDVPTVVTLPELPGSVHATSLGEFGTRLFLYNFSKDVNSSASAAAGWDGDRVVALGTGPGAGYAWVTAWDTPFDAAEFASAAGAAIAKRYRDSTATTTADVRRFNVPGRSVTIQIAKVSGRDVVVVRDTPGASDVRLDLARITLR